jgi:GLPGLI family protein
MKNAFVLICCLGSLFTGKTQVKEGMITYERKMDMYKTIPDEQFKAMMPQYRTSKHQLLFSDSSSVYKALAEEEAPDPFGGPGGPGPGMLFFGGGDGVLYKNFTNGKSVESSDLGAKTYLIQDSIQSQSWKLTGETKKISGHNCFKAICKQMVLVPSGNGPGRMMPPGNQMLEADTSHKAPPTLQQKEIQIMAWYAEDLISPAGPENYGGLPGVILQLDRNNGETVYTAVEIKNLSSKKESREEYRKLIQEMMMNQGPPPGMRGDMRRDN